MGSLPARPVRLWPIIAGGLVRRQFFEKLFVVMKEAFFVVVDEN